MTLAQCAVGGIVHDQKGNVTIADPKVQQLHDMGMFQTKSACLIDKFLQVLLIAEARLQHFDRRQGLVMYMLAQIDIAKASSTQAAGEVVVTKALAYMVCHLQTPFYDTL